MVSEHKDTSFLANLHKKLTIKCNKTEPAEGSKTLRRFIKGYFLNNYLISIFSTTGLPLLRIVRLITIFPDSGAAICTPFRLKY